MLARGHEAVAQARRRLDLQRTVVGDDHPDYATGLNQLALLLIMHGDPEEAEPLLRRALAIRRAAPGEAHPDYATSLSSLAGLLWARGDLDGAEPLLRQALEIRRQVLDADHPRTVASASSLDQLLRMRRDLADHERGREEVPGDTAAAVSPPDPSPPEPVPDAGAPDRVAEAPADSLESLDLAGLSEQLDAMASELMGLGERLTRVAEAIQRHRLPPPEALPGVVGWWFVDP